MKLTKYEHACLALEEQGKKLVIDPGEYTLEFGDLTDIVAAVVTHVHGDHFSRKNLQTIIDNNPNVRIFSTAQTAEAWPGQPIQAVKAGDEHSVGPFTVRFYGGLHKQVHPAWQPDQNVGVLVNDRFYYPGDSLTVPDRDIELAAVPVGSSWLSTGEAIDFVAKVNPYGFIRTHERLLSRMGVEKTDEWLQKASERFGPIYYPLDPGESIKF